MKMTYKVHSNEWSGLIDELEERSFQGVTFDMEDLSFVYFLAKDTTDIFEIKICFESRNIYQRELGCEDWWYVDYLESTIPIDM
jgi:hypothetical protein